MPGLIVKLDVAEGDEVQEGQALCTDRGDEDGKHPARRTKGRGDQDQRRAGDSLAVDDVIMEFE